MSCYNNPLCHFTTNHYVLLQQASMSCYKNPLCPVTTHHYVQLQQPSMPCYTGHNDLL
jgi:hypothetical protein